MKHTVKLAGAIAVAMALGVTAAGWTQPPGHGSHAVDHSTLAPPSKDDPHVKRLYDVLKTAHQAGGQVDHAKVMADIKAIVRDYAVKAGQDPAVAEEHVMQVVHQAMTAAQAHPEKMATLDGFWELLHTAGDSVGHH